LLRPKALFNPWCTISLAPAVAGHRCASDQIGLVFARAGASQVRMQDANAQFDQTVLDLIEHSPTGSVPGTPAYQDALKRLYAAHQVYASADHKGGHVTARSLATLPLFHASNLDAVRSGQVPLEALESNRTIYDRYVQSLPAAARERAEALRDRVAGRPVHHRPKHGATGGEAGIHDPAHTLFLVPGTGPHPGLPGNYLYGSALQLSGNVASARWSVQVHDGDDGAAFYDAPSMSDALAKVLELAECAPFTLDEIVDLGFVLN
jgi:hypothetical protein